MRKSRYLQASAKHVGLSAIVGDNSYIHYPGVTNTEKWDVVELAGKVVRITAKPFSLTFQMPFRQRIRTREFVTVMYDGHLFVVLNDFKEIIEPKFKWIPDE